jgi:hypothetical protein
MAKELFVGKTFYLLAMKRNNLPGKCCSKYKWKKVLIWQSKNCST